MPVLVEPDQSLTPTLLRDLPSGTHAVTDRDHAHGWLAHHLDEYAVVVGPSVPVDDAYALAQGLRTSRPTVSVVLVADELSTPVLSGALQAGVRDVVPVEDGEALRAAVERAYELFSALRGPSGPAHRGKVVTVWSPKGGVGKTTVAVNVALGLADRGARRVCLLDLDLAFGDVAITLQLFPTHTIEHAIGAEQALTDGRLDADLIDGLLTRHVSRDGGALMVLAAPAHPDVRERISPALVSALVETLRTTFDVVVVDTSPSFDEQTLTALDATDDIVIVATLDVPTLKNVKVGMETLDALDLARDRRYLLLNRADEQVGLSADRVEALLGLRPAAKVVSSVDVAAATNAGTPILTARPTHPASQAMLELTTLLAGQDIAPPVTLLPHADAAPRRRWKRRSA